MNSQAPASGQRVSSPVHVAAALKPFMPGSAEVRVVQVVNGQPNILGTGRVYGIPEMVFSGDIRYRTPTVATGWVLIVERSIETAGPYQKGEVLGGDAIRVIFVRSDRPDVVSVFTYPAALAEHGAWWELPTGVGSVSFNAKVERADRVQFYLVPTGTNGWAQRRVLPGDAYMGHPWGAFLAYADAPLSARLVIVAAGPGGQTTYDAHGIYHN